MRLRGTHCLRALFSEFSRCLSRHNCRPAVQTNLVWRGRVPTGRAARAAARAPPRGAARRGCFLGVASGPAGAPVTLHRAHLLACSSDVPRAARSEQVPSLRPFTALEGAPASDMPARPSYGERAVGGRPRAPPPRQPPASQGRRGARADRQRQRTTGTTVSGGAARCALGDAVTGPPPHASVEHSRCLAGSRPEQREMFPR